MRTTQTQSIVHLAGYERTFIHVSSVLGYISSLPFIHHFQLLSPKKKISRKAFPILKSNVVPSLLSFIFSFCILTANLSFSSSLSHFLSLFFSLFLFLSFTFSFSLSLSLSIFSFALSLFLSLFLSLSFSLSLSLFRLLDHSNINGNYVYLIIYTALHTPPSTVFAKKRRKYQEKPFRYLNQM